MTFYHRRACIAILVLSLLPLASKASKDVVAVTEISPTLLVVATSSGNVIASVGPDGAFLTGLPSSNSTPAINALLKTRTKSAVRYVVIAPQDSAHSEGDAGWGKLGAFVAMQERALERLGGHGMGTTRALPPRLIQLGVDRPRVSFSDVLTFDLNGEAIHVIHQSPGYSDADSLVHFHLANLVYAGEVFPGIEYPSIEPALGASIDGFLKTLAHWTESTLRVVPARGKFTNGTDVKAFCDMLMAVRDRVKGQIDAGKTETEVLAQRPTATFDERWARASYC